MTTYNGPKALVLAVGTGDGADVERTLLKAKLLRFGTVNGLESSCRQLFGVRN